MPVSDLMVTSAEIYNELAGVHLIDQTISEAEREVEEGAESNDVYFATEELKKSGESHQIL